MSKHNRKPKPRPAPQSAAPRNPAQVRIEMPDGQRLRFSESLVAFVANRPGRERRRGFRLGDWIASLDDGTLGHLADLAEQALSGAEPPGRAGEDLLSVAVHAACAERRVGKVRVDEEKAHAWLAAIFAGALFESFRREGLVEFDAPISIESKGPGEFAFTVTEKGMAAGGQAGQWLH